MAHQHNRSVLLVEQDWIGAVLHARDDAGLWRSRELAAANDDIILPGIGVIGRLGEAYESTPLDPWRIR